MANTYYTWQATTNTADLIDEMVRFMVNDHATITGPGFSVIDTYSSGAATPHEVPSDATDLDSLAADNSWRTGSLATTDYIILESSSSSNKFQVGIEYQSTTILRFVVAPTGGFNTSNDNADMPNSGNWDNAVLTTFDFSTTNSAGNMAITANDDRFILGTKNSTTYRWTYIGKLTDTHTGDSNPVVQYDNNEANVYGQYNSGLGGSTGWERLSPVDGSTKVDMAATMPDNANVGDLPGNATDYMTDSDTGAYRLFPMLLGCDQFGHTGLYGQLDGVYITNEDLSQVAQLGTLGTKAYMYLASTTTNGTIVWDWDGTTAIT